jgi:cytochrome b561
MDQQNISSSQTSPFHQKHSAALRIWHWLTFLVISGSIITVLINSTILSPRANVKMVQEQLSKKGVSVTNEQAFAVSHEYEDRMWDVHKYFGIGLAFLFLARIVIEFAQPEEHRIRSRFKKASKAYREKGPDSTDHLHYLRVKQTYLVFFVLLFLMVVTGLSMAFGRDLGISRDAHHTIKEIHSFIQYFIYAFIFVHLGGVILAENGRFRGIVSGMIHGNRS